MPPHDTTAATDGLGQQVGDTSTGVIHDHVGCPIGADDGTQGRYPAREHHASGNRVEGIDRTIVIGIEHRIVEHLTVERIHFDQLAGTEAGARVGGINGGGREDNTPEHQAGWVDDPLPGQGVVVHQRQVPALLGGIGDIGLAGGHELPRRPGKILVIDWA